MSDSDKRRSLIQGVRKEALHNPSPIYSPFSNSRFNSGQERNGLCADHRRHGSPPRRNGAMDFVWCHRIATSRALRRASVRRALRCMVLARTKTPKPFVAACDKFVFTEILRPTAVHSLGLPSQQEHLQPGLAAAVNAAAREDGWAALSAVGSLLVKASPSFDPRNYRIPETWRARARATVLGGEIRSLQVMVRRTYTSMYASKRPNPPVNADARVGAVLCKDWRARAGYWER